MSFWPQYHVQVSGRTTSDTILSKIVLKVHYNIIHVKKMFGNIETSVQRFANIINWSSVVTKENKYNISPENLNNTIIQSLNHV